MNAPPFEISATDIQLRIRAGEPIDDLVPDPDAIAAYIAEHGMYRED